MTSAWNRITARILPFLLLVATVSTGPGCVQRRMTIRSNPPGAQVYVDNHDIGRTPVSSDFIYYGKRKIRLVKDGYETLTVEQSVWPKWYQIPGIDFFAENVLPLEVRDERQFDYQMQPLLVVPSETLLSRAEELRRGNQVIPANPNVTAPSTIGLPGQFVPAPSATPPVNVAPTPTTGSPYLPPPAVLNYPPAATSATPPAPVSPYLPPDYGGRPVAPLP